MPYAEVKVVKNLGVTLFLTGPQAHLQLDLNR